MRAVSLLPSVTETMRWWGVEPVACTRFCEQPDLPHVGGTKDPDIDAIAALGPDLVVLDEEENRREDADALLARDIAIHVTAVRSMADVAPTLTALAAALGLPSCPPIPRLPVLDGQEPVRAFVPIWRRPWMTINADTYGSSLLDAIGVANLYAAESNRYPTVADLAEVRSRAPDCVIAPSEPYPFADRHRRELETVAPTLLVDGRDLFWWGIRTSGAVERLFTQLRRWRDLTGA